MYIIGERFEKEIQGLSTFYVSKTYNSLCMSVNVSPVSSCSSFIDPTQTTSSPSSLIHRGRGVPQYRLRLMAQSRAPFSQLANLFSFTKSGTLQCYTEIFTITRNCHIRMKSRLQLMSASMLISCSQLIGLAKLHSCYNRISV